MRVRTVIPGIAAGYICLAALWFQYYRIEPARFVPNWPLAAQAATLPAWVPTAILAFCGVTLFTAGWIAARWNWAENWRRSLQAGAGMGVLAGCLIFDFIGAFWSGIKGQAEILRNYYNPVSQAEGTKIVIEAVVQTGSVLYVNFVLIILACVLIGGLGGIASALVDRKDFWGSDPRKPEGWLFRLPAYLLTLFGFINLIVSIAVLRLAIPKVLASAIRLQAESNVQASVDSSRFFDLFSNLTIWLFAFLPLGLTWGWILRKWLLKKRMETSSVLWVVLSAAAFLGSFWFLSPGLFSSVLNVSFLGLACLAGVFIGFITEERAEGFPYRTSDWIGYGLSFGILAGTQLVAGIVSYSFAVVLITITNISHLVQGETGPIVKTPVEQVDGFFRTEYLLAQSSILIFIGIGLAIASFVSFMRTVLEVKDAASAGE